MAVKHRILVQIAKPLRLSLFANFQQDANVFDHRDIQSLPTDLHQCWLLQLCTNDNIHFCEDRMKKSADKASCLASIPSFGLRPQNIYNE
jgi:hypothetical protein